MIPALAETAAATAPALGDILPWITSFVVAVLGAVGVTSAKKSGKAEGKAEALMIGPQPFMIELKEQFITRREFDQLANMMAVNNTKLEGVISESRTEMKLMFRETMVAIASQNTSLTRQISNQNERLSKKMESIASGAYEARGKMHVKINDQGERLATMESTSDIAGQIGKLADALNPQTRVQPTHSTTHP